MGVLGRPTRCKGRTARCRGTGLLVMEPALGDFQKFFVLP
jgi:hypothetical protein